MIVALEDGGTLSLSLGGPHELIHAVRPCRTAQVTSHALKLHQGRPPRNKGQQYPPNPPTVEEIIAVMQTAGESPDGLRLRGVIVVLWRAGLRISEALSLEKSDLDAERGALLVRHGKGDKRREVGMDRWAWTQLQPWLEFRQTLAVGALFCILRGPTRGRPCASAGIRGQLHRTAAQAGVRRRFAPYQLRRAHAVEMSREACRYWSFNDSSVMPTSGSRPPICGASTTPRRSTPFTSAPSQ